MDNKLLPRSENIFSRIKRFIKKFICKNTTSDNSVVTNEKKKVLDTKKNNNNFEKLIKVDFNDLKVDMKNMDLDEYLENIEKNPQYLKKLSVDRLLILKEYVNKELEKYNAKIESLKKLS